jgi:hypothetical protein
MAQEYYRVQLKQKIKDHEVGEEAVMLANIRESYLLRFDDKSEEWVLASAFKFSDEE